jgi:hypothetical protein
MADCHLMDAAIELSKNAEPGGISMRKYEKYDRGESR